MDHFSTITWIAFRLTNTPIIIAMFDQIDKKIWRQKILNALSRLFEGKTNLLYGLNHALDVETQILKTISSLNHRNSLDLEALQAAALLHDIGFAKRSPDWTEEGVEHIAIGQELAITVLREIKEFYNHPSRVEKILYLIEHHDSTTYRFPSPFREGVLVQHPKNNCPIDQELSLLKEADAIVHAQAFLSHFQEWKTHLPLILPNSPISTWQWMESAIGNVRLLARRVLIDAHSPMGERLSTEIFFRLENWISQLCQNEGIVYVPHLSLPAERNDARRKLINKPFQFQLISFRDWRKLETILRQVTLLYNPDIHPYQQAEISTSLIDINSVQPMALYLLRNRLEETLELHAALIYHFGLSLFDLPGLLDFRYNSSKITIAPPLVEVYYEDHEHKKKEKILGLVDGLHRMYAAKHLDVKRVRVILISNVRFPLVPLPVRWEQVKLYNSVPQEKEKRLFRYERFEDFPFDQYPDLKNVNQNNYRNYFFRDLRPLGSHGKR